MELVNSVLLYLSFPETQQAVLVPGVLALLALYYLEPKERTMFFGLLVFSTIASYTSAKWNVTEELRQLFILPCAFFSVAGLLWARIPISAHSAFAATYLSLWIVDMSMAMQLVHDGEATWTTFFHGVGGAGYQDGLFVFPAVAAALVPYAVWRQRKEVALPLALSPRFA